MTSTPALSPGVTFRRHRQPPEGKRDTGRPNTGGPIVTASGLIFIGATDDARFRAFDTGTGKELWSTKLDFPGHATPITYDRDGRQYVAIVATGGAALGSRSGGDSLVVFRFAIALTARAI